MRQHSVNKEYMTKKMGNKYLEKEINFLCVLQKVKSKFSTFVVVYIASGCEIACFIIIILVKKNNVLTVRIRQWW